jgi:hypothetical protein
LRVCVLLHQYDEEGDDIMAAQSDQWQGRNTNIEEEEDGLSVVKEDPQTGRQLNFKLPVIGQLRSWSPDERRTIYTHVL